MSATSAGPKRFTPTTFILLLLLIGAVIGAGKLALPDPPAPPEPPKKMDPKMAAQMQKNMEKQYGEQLHKMAGEKNKFAPQVKPVADPNAIEIDNNYFNQVKPGEEGLKQNDEEMKRKKAAFDAYQLKLQEAKAKAVREGKTVDEHPITGGAVPTK